MSQCATEMESIKENQHNNIVKINTVLTVVGKMKINPSCTAWHMLFPNIKIPTVCGNV